MNVRNTPARRDARGRRIVVSREYIDLPTPYPTSLGWPVQLVVVSDDGFQNKKGDSNDTNKAYHTAYAQATSRRVNESLRMIEVLCHVS